MTDENFDTNQKTLSEWVKDFRVKKLKMKRKLRQSGAQLRVCAVLATALKTAEKELRRKQQERFNRWAELQAQLIEKEAACKRTKDEQSRQNEIELWKYEISSIDEFMRSMSNQRHRVAVS